MHLSEHLSSKNIVLDLKGENKFQVIEELLDVLEEDPGLEDHKLASADILAREGYLSTGLENGLAIPHAKTDGVAGLTVALGIKREGIDFESLDGKPANIIFLVLSPRDTSGPHIQTLAVITRNLKEEQVRQTILNADTVDTVYTLIQERFNI